MHGQGMVCKLHFYLNSIAFIFIEKLIFKH